MNKLSALKALKSKSAIERAAERAATEKAASDWFDSFCSDYGAFGQIDEFIQHGVNLRINFRILEVKWSGSMWPVKKPRIFTAVVGEDVSVGAAIALEKESWKSAFIADARREVCNFMPTNRRLCLTGISLTESSDDIPLLLVRFCRLKSGSGFTRSENYGEFMVPYWTNRKEIADMVAKACQAVSEQSLAALDILMEDM